jgi:hypothetical protein
MLKLKIFLNHYLIEVYKILIKFHARYRIGYSKNRYKGELPCKKESTPCKRLNGTANEKNEQIILLGRFDLVQYLTFNFFKLGRYRWIPFDVIDIFNGKATLEIAAYGWVQKLNRTV